MGFSGAMLSHDNVSWNSKSWARTLDWTDKEVIMSYLPLSHIAGLILDVYMPFLTGATLGIADKEVLRGTLVDNLRDIRPTQMLGVPRIFEKVRERMQGVDASKFKDAK